MNGKEIAWHQAFEEYSHIADSLGRPIDAGILETVIVLNLFGIETTGSCEGHLEREQTNPWIDIEARSAQEETKHVLQMFASARKELEQAMLPQDEINALFSQAHKAQNQVRLMHLQQREKLMCYLSQFYQHRQVPYDRLLVVHPRDTTGRARLESHGASMMGLWGDERQKKLLEYQHEMAVFTQFLKRVYFSQGEEALLPLLSVSPIFWFCRRRVDRA
jgi:hypothetical protein